MTVLQKDLLFRHLRNIARLPFLPDFYVIGCVRGKALFGVVPLKLVNLLHADTFDVKL